MNLTIQKLKQFSADPVFQNCARAAMMAQAFAQLERERVDAYIQPLFEIYTFTVSPDMCGRGDRDAGQVITDRGRLYLAPDSQTTPFYRECDKEHRKHGFTGPEGHCPALTAEHLQIIAENNLLDYGLAGLELGFDRSALWGEKRKKMLDLLLGMAAQQPGFRARAMEACA